MTGMGVLMDDQLIELQFGNIIIDHKEDKAYIDDADQLIDKIRRIPGVVGVTKRLRIGATLETDIGDKKVAPWYFIGIDPENEKSVTDLQDFFIDGSYLSGSDEEIMIGSEMVGKGDGLITPVEDSLQSEVGDWIYVTYENGIRKKYRLKGIIGAKDLFSIITAYITIDEAEKILQVNNKATSIHVRSPKGKEDEYVRKIMELGVNEDVLTWRDKAVMNAAITDSFDILNNTFKVVGLFIVFITIIIIIYINILNSKKSIGIFRAIGIRKSTVTLSYVCTSFLYAVAGILVASVVIFLLFNYLMAKPLQGPLGDLYPVFNIFSYVISVFSVMISAIVGSLIPSLGINRKNIMDLILGR
jgi:putative ABC transport system permease protein